MLVGYIWFFIESLSGFVAISATSFVRFPSRYRGNDRLVLESQRDSLLFEKLVWRSMDQGV
jgi:hypothetical protein